MDYYGQIDFPDIQGVEGKYPISEVGSLLIAQSNLLMRLGHEADPLTLNEFYKEHDLYREGEDGIKDDLQWESVTKYEGDLKIVKMDSGWPRTNLAIVRFRYQSVSEPYITIGGEQQPHIISHYCLIDDYQKHTIVDSYDGQVKEAGPYASPVGYAVYELAVTKSKEPPIDEMITYSALPSVRKMYIKKGGAAKYTFNNATLYKDFKPNEYFTEGTEVYIAGTAHHPIAPNGEDFYMNVADFGVWNQTGKVARTEGFRFGELKDHRPVPDPEPGTIEEAIQSDLHLLETPPPRYVATKIDAYAWQETYKPYRNNQGKDILRRYHARNTQIIPDLSKEKHPELPLQAEAPVSIRGEFYKNDTHYGLAIVPEKYGGKNAWYGIPMTNLRPEDDDIPSYKTAIEERKALNRLSAYDKFQLSRARVELGLNKVFDVIRVKKIKK